MLRRPVLLLFLLSSVFSAVHALLGYHPPPRLIAIGDLHGDITNAMEILKFVQVVDCDGKWIAGHDTVIQMGDVVDRGPHGHEIIEYFADLKQQAQLSGGEFVQLLGNHELMNMQGDTKFVNPDSVKAFGGLDRLKAAFDPVSGAYGAHLVQTCDAAVIRNRTVFVHAGLLPEFAELGVETINRLVRQNLRAKNFSHSVLMNDGPLWTRQIIYPALQGNCSNVREALRRLSQFEEKHGRPPVDRMVIGHTIMQDGAVHVLCDEKLYAIDIAISQYMQGGGHLGLLELRYDFGGHSTRLTPFMQYPSQPFKQHSLPPVQFPKRIPLLPRVDGENAQGVQKVALTIRSSGDELTHTEVVLLCVAFAIVAGVILLQRQNKLSPILGWVPPRWLSGSKLKRHDDEA